MSGTFGADLRQGLSYSIATDKSKSKDDDIKTLESLDDRYFTEDYDPVSDILPEIDIDIDFSLPLAERLRKAFGSTNKEVHAEDLQLPPPPSFFEENGDMDPSKVHDMLGSPRVNPDNHILEHHLHKLEQLQRAVERVLSSRILTHSGQFLAGLTQVTRVSQEVAIASDIATRAKRALAHARAGMGAQAIALAAHERARARAVAVETVLSAVDMIYQSEREARALIERGDVAGGVEIIARTQRWVSEAEGGSVLESVGALSEAVKRLGQTEAVIVDSCMRVARRVAAGAASIRELGPTLRAIVMRGTPHLAVEVVGRGMKEWLDEEIEADIRKRMDGEEEAGAARQTIQTGLGCEDSRLGRMLPLHAVRDAVMGVGESGRSCVAALRVVGVVTRALLYRYEDLLDEARCDEGRRRDMGARAGKEEKRRSRKDGKAGKNTGVIDSFPIPGIPEDSRAGKYISELGFPARDWAWLRDLTLQDLIALPDQPSTNTTITNPSTSSTASASASTSAMLEAAATALDDIRYSLATLPSRTLQLFLDVLATLTALSDCRRHGNRKGHGLGSEDTYSIVRECVAWVAAARGLWERVEREGDGHDEHGHGSREVRTLPSSNPFEDSFSLADFAADDRDGSALAHLGDGFSALLPTAASPSLSTTLRTDCQHLRVLAQKLSAMCVSRLRDHANNIFRNCVEYGITAFSNDVFRPIALKREVDIMQQIPELRIRVGRQGARGTMDRLGVQVLIAGASGKWDFPDPVDCTVAGVAPVVGLRQGDSVYSHLLLDAWEKQSQSPLALGTPNPTASPAHAHTSTPAAASQLAAALAANDTPLVHTCDPHREHTQMLSLVAPLVYHTADPDLYASPAPTHWTNKPFPSVPVAERPAATAELEWGRVCTLLSECEAVCAGTSVLAVIRMMGKAVQASIDLSVLECDGAEIVKALVLMYIYNVVTRLGPADTVECLLDPSKWNKWDSAAGKTTTGKSSKSGMFPFPLTPGKDKIPVSKNPEYSPILDNAFSQDVHSLPTPSYAPDASPAERMPWLSHVLRSVQYDTEQGSFAGGLYPEFTVAFNLASKAAQEAHSTHVSSSSTSGAAFAAAAANASSGGLPHTPSTGTSTSSAVAKSGDGKSSRFLNSLKARVQKTFTTDTHATPGTSSGGAGMDHLHPSSAMMSSPGKTSGVGVGGGIGSGGKALLLPPPTFAELSPVVALTGKDNCFGMVERLVAVRSLFLLGHTLTRLCRACEGVLPPQQSQLLGRVAIETYGAARDAAVLFSESVGQAVAREVDLPSLVGAVDWTVRDLAVIHHAYVGHVTNTIGLLKRGLSANGDVPGVGGMWSAVAKAVTTEFLRVIAGIGKWTDEGRASLALDISMLRIGLEPLLGCKPLPGISTVSEYVSAYHFPPDNFTKWIREGAVSLGLSRADIISLAWAGPADSVDKVQRNSFISRVSHACDDNDERLRAASTTYKIRSTHVREEVLKTMERERHTRMAAAALAEKERSSPAADRASENVFVVEEKDRREDAQDASDAAKTALVEDATANAADSVARRIDFSAGAEAQAEKSDSKGKGKPRSDSAATLDEFVFFGEADEMP